MFDEDNAQNGNQPDELATRIANMFRAPQASGNNDGDGDYVNRNIALRVDPATGTAYRVQPGQTPPATTGSTQQQTYLPPIQTCDPQGKTLPKYRMGIGHRILATVANFANGFAGNAAAPVYVGPGALNNRYYQDEALREQQNEQNQRSSRDGRLNTAGTSPEDDGMDDLNNDGGGGPSPKGTQVGPGPAKRPSGRQRFGNVRKQKHGY